MGESIEALEARQLMGRLGTPEEIAGAALYLASDEAAFVTGSVLTIEGVDDGISLAGLHETNNGSGRRR